MYISFELAFLIYKIISSITNNSHGVSAQKCIVGAVRSRRFFSADSRSQRQAVIMGLYISSIDTACTLGEGMPKVGYQYTAEQSTNTTTIHTRWRRGGGGLLNVRPSRPAPVGALADKGCRPPSLGVSRRRSRRRGEKASAPNGANDAFLR